MVTGTITLNGPTSADCNGSSGTVNLTIQPNSRGGNGPPGTNAATAPETIPGRWNCGAGY